MAASPETHRRVYIHTLFAGELSIQTSWHTHCGEPDRARGHADNKLLGKSRGAI